MPKKTTEGLTTLAIEAEFYEQEPEAQKILADAQLALMRAYPGSQLGWATSLVILRAVGRLLYESGEAEEAGNERTKLWD